MSLKLGNRIAKLRREKGLTQEQLAEALGVSAPAVSKWETDSSYPDITMLMPLARALGTDVDTLLAWQESLTEEEAGELTGEILALIEKRKFSQAWEELMDALHRFPNCDVLKYQAISVLTTLEISETAAGEEQGESCSPKNIYRQKKRLCRELYESKNPLYFETVVPMLVSLALRENDLKEAERLLLELPEDTSDVTFLWSSLYTRQGDYEKALEIVQKRLFQLAARIQALLVTLAEETLCPDVGKALEILEVYRKMEEIFGCSGGVADGLFATAYLRKGEKEKAFQSLLAYMDRILGDRQPPNPLLFAPTFPDAGIHKGFSPIMKQMLFKGVLEDEALAALREMPECQEAIRKMQETLQNEQEHL